VRLQHERPHCPPLFETSRQRSAIAVARRDCCCGILAQRRCGAQPRSFDLGVPGEPQAFAQWDQYDTLNPQNANLTYLRLERAQFE